MIWLIARRRFSLNLLTFRFFAGSLICVLLVIISSLVSNQDLKARVDYYQSLVTEHKEKLESAQTYVQMIGMVVMRPSPLSLVNEGVGERFGIAAEAPGVFNPVRILGRSQENSFLLSFSSFDLAHVIVIILSLMALTLTFDAIAGEREEGTLRLVLSNRMPRDKLILGEYLGSMLTMALPLVVSFLAWLIIVRSFHVISLDSESWLRLSFIFIVTFIFLSAFAWLGILISASTKLSSTSIMISLFVWVLMAVVCPDVSSWLATKIRPVETGEMHERGEVFEPDLRSLPGGKRLLEEMTKLPKLPVRERILRRKRLQEEFGGKIQQALRDLEAQAELRLNQMIRQAELARALLLFSPISAYLSMTAIIARTDTGSYIRFRIEANRLQGEISRWQNEKMKIYPDRTMHIFSSPLDKSGFPQPNHPSESLAKSIYRSLPEISALLLLNVILFAGAFIAFRKYDPR